MLELNEIQINDLSIETSFIVGLLLGFLISILFIYKSLEVRRLRRSWPDYNLEAGDTLSFISEKTGESWQKIAKVNKLSAPYDLFYGDVIKVPQGFIEPGRDDESEDINYFEEDDKRAEHEHKKVTVTTTVTTEDVDTKAMSEPNMLKEVEDIETIEEIFEDDIPQAEIAKELAKRPKKSIKKKSKKISVKTKKK